MATISFVDNLKTKVVEEKSPEKEEPVIKPATPRAPRKKAEVK
jgi:hypothetical protein